MKKRGSSAKSRHRKEQELIKAISTSVVFVVWSSRSVIHAAVLMCATSSVATNQ